jgi:hypothetical protein
MQESLTLMVIANFANSSGGNAFPSLKTLGTITKFSRRTLQGVLRSLEEKHLLTITGQRGGSRPPTYTLHVSQTPKHAVRDGALPDPVDLRAMPYRDYLRTHHWQAIRLAALRRADQRCQLCNTRKRLHVHHRSYAFLGQEYDHMEDVVVLCAPCHAKHHGKEVSHGHA